MNVPQTVEMGAVYGLAQVAESVYAACANGLWHLQGENWQQVTIADASDAAITAVAAVGQYVLAGAHGAMICSSDAGQTWTLAGLAHPAPLVMAVACSPTYESDGFAVAGTAEDGVFVTEDHGQSWVPWNYGLIDTDVQAVGVSPDFRHDRTVFAATATGIYRSRNGGRSWHALTLPADHAPWLCLVVYEGALLAGNEAGHSVVSYDMGDHWHELDLGDWAGRVINALAVADDTVYLLAEDALLRLSHDMTALHFVASLTPQGPLALLPDDDGIWLGLAEGGVTCVGRS